MKTNFLNGVQSVIGVAAFLMAASMVPQQARASQSDDLGSGYTYFQAGLGLAGTAAVAGVHIGFSDEAWNRIPVGGDKAVKLMRGYEHGYIQVSAPLSAQRLKQIEGQIRASKPDMITLYGEQTQFSTRIHYDKLDRPTNMKEVLATLKRAKKSKTPIGSVTFKGRANSTGFTLYSQAPSVLSNPKQIQTVRKIRNTAGLLTAVPLTAWLVDKATQAAGVPQSRKGYVADRFEKALDTVVGKFSPSGLGKTKANGAN